MFRDEFQAVCNGAKGKLNLMNSNPVGYFIAAMLAGAFVAFGGFVAFTAGVLRRVSRLLGIVLGGLEPRGDGGLRTVYRQ